LRANLSERLRLTNPERSTPAEIGRRLRRKALEQVACVAKPATILASYRRLVAQKFDGSKHRNYPGRSPISRDVIHLVVQIARENPSWGYDRIVGALSNLGHEISDQSVGNILRSHGIRPACKRSANTAWKDFIAARMAVLAGVPPHKSREQEARNAIDEVSGHARHLRFVLHDQDTKICVSSRKILATGDITCLLLAPRRPNLNAFVGRWMRSVKHERLSKRLCQAAIRRPRTRSSIPRQLHPPVVP
jgi:hypothetical protein